MKKTSLKKLIAAYLIDMVLLSAILQLFWQGINAGHWLSEESFSFLMKWISPVLSAVVYTSYFAFFEHRKGKTLGKSVSELQTAQAENPEAKPPFHRLLLAYGIDILLLMCFMRLVHPVMHHLMMTMSKPLFRPPWAPFLYIPALIALVIKITMYVSYFAIPEYILGNSLGKKIAGLKVLQEKEERPDIKIPGFWRLFLAYTIDAVLIAIGITVCCLMAPEVADPWLGMAIAVCAIAYFLPSLLLFSAYMSLTESCAGKSLGKSLVSLRIFAGPTSSCRASFWKLLVAYLVDFSWAFSIVFLPFFITEPGKLWRLILGVLIMCCILYFVIFEKLLRGSVGKKLMRLQVVPDEISK